MTPLIREMVSINPEASTEYMWFDASEVAKSSVVDPTDEVLGLPMPFPLCAVVIDSTGKNSIPVKTLLFIQERTGARGVSGWVVSGEHAQPIPAFVYSTDEPGAIQLTKNELPYDVLSGLMKSVLSYVYTYLLSIHSPAPIPGYTPVDKQKFSNKKRIAKGKAPIYEWTTIVIEPPKPKAEPKGGTHASPRLHDRRGHYRKLRSGKLAWVQPCKVGDASKGTVFKDYKWKSHDTTRQA